MDNNIKISVIIPHYNIPDLLVRALRSVPQREDVQVIVVDDGSVNADKYIERHPELSAFNVEFYPQPHCGLAGRMRNIGLEHAKGEWVTFLDADDLFAEGADRIFTEVQQYSEDIVYYRTVAAMSDDLSISSRRFGFDCFFDIKDPKEQERYFRYVHSFPTGKIIKKDLIDNFNIRFEEVTDWNDVYFSACIGVYAKDIRVCQDYLYVLTERNGSLTSDKLDTKSVRLKKYDTRLGVALRTYRMLRKHKVYLPVEAYHLNRAVGQYRQKDKLQYIGLLLRMLFIFPACTFYYIKKDVTHAFRKIAKK